jgi:membrane fusion protein (multidrug efflux system)
MQSTADLLKLQRRLSDGQLTRDEAKPNAVQLILEDGSQYPVEGTLQFRDVSVDASTGSVILRMVFPNPKGVLLPGMFVRALVKEGVSGKAILIPQQAVLRDPKGNPLAMIVEADGKAQPRPLKLDRAIGDKWMVTSGLVAGQRVIVEGLQRVRPGTPVRAVPFSPGATSPTPPGSPSQPAPKSN